MRCTCALPHEPRLVVLTGGPGAGKTAVLEVVRRHFCQHVEVLPESASILFGGGFPRHATLPGRRGAQRAIFRVQRELERLTLEERELAVVLCDRGTVDGAAYWPEEHDGFFEQVATTREAELARYAAVIHLRVPTAAQGYNRRNPLRMETAEEARVLDDKILAAWGGHPRRFIVESSEDFMAKVTRALEIVRAEVPVCCRQFTPTP